MGWKEEYIKMIGCVNPDHLQIEPAQSLKIINLPQYLYKYRAVNNYALDNLRNDTVWVNPPKDYNDPFECVEYMDYDRIFEFLMTGMEDEVIAEVEKHTPISDELKKKTKQQDKPLDFLAEELFKEEGNFDSAQVKEFIRILNESMKKMVIDRNVEKVKNTQNLMKICSFCESPKQLLMWSHYADQHKGFCIEYDISKWNNGDIRKRVLYPVIYQDNLYDWTDHLLQMMNAGNFNNLYPLISCATKSKEWEYEQEWRFIFNIGESFKAQNYTMNCQSSVYAGYRISDEDKEKLLSVCNEKSLKLYQAKPSIEQYKLDFELIYEP